MDAKTLSSKAQSPYILHPGATSQNWVSKDLFDLTENFVFSVKLTFPSVTVDEKELLLTFFLADSEPTDIFGATTSRGGLCDYSSKGEVGELLTIEDNEIALSYKGQDVMLLADHVYPYSINSLVRNQRAFNTTGLDNTNLVSVVFDPNNLFGQQVTDKFNNVYFDPVNPTDILTDTIITDLSEYVAPLYIQIGSHIFIVDLKALMPEATSLYDFKHYTFRFNIENFGKFFRMDVLKPGQNQYEEFINKKLDYDFSSKENVRFGYGITSPVTTFSLNKQTNINIEILHIQGKLK